MSNYSSYNPPPRDSDADLNHSFDQNFTSAEELLASLGETLHQPSVHPPFDDSRYKYIAEDSGSTDWNYGQEGLLPPLRRPDVNQIPADVLALLLKTARFGEILNFTPSAGNGQEMNTNSQQAAFVQHDYGQPRNQTQDQGWNQHQQQPIRQFQEPVQPVARTPRQVAQSPQQQGPHPSSIDRLSHSSFTLSPAAKEFVPRTVDYNPNELAMAVAQINLQQQEAQQQGGYYNQQQYGGGQRQQQQQGYQPRQQQYQARGQQQQSRPRYQQQQYYQPPHHRNQNQPPRQQGYSSNNPRQQHQQHYQQQSDYQHFEDFQGPDPSVERVLTTITDIIAHLTTCPGDFNSSVRKAVRVLQESLYDADTLGIIITLIVEQSIANRNFSYTGAKLCQALNENGIQANGVTVMETLIRRVEEVFKAYAETISIGSIEIKEREIGLLFFLAELFMNYSLDQGKKFFGFGVAALEIMTNLITTKPNSMLEHEKVKCVVQILKLAGWDLENHSNPKLRTDMEKLMKDLSYILVMSEDVAPQTKDIVQRVIDLKKRNWDHEEAESSGGEQSSPAPRSEADGPTPNAYNGKAQHPVYELPDSDDDDLLLDDEPDEVNAFYEEFLRGLPQKR